MNWWPVRGLPLCSLLSLAALLQKIPVWLNSITAAVLLKGYEHGHVRSVQNNPPPTHTHTAWTRQPHRCFDSSIQAALSVIATAQKTGKLWFHTASRDIFQVSTLLCFKDYRQTEAIKFSSEIIAACLCVHSELACWYGCAPKESLLCMADAQKHCSSLNS